MADLGVNQAIISYKTIPKPLKSEIDDLALQSIGFSPSIKL
jgi:hypothetical protein